MLALLFGLIVAFVANVMLTKLYLDWRGRRETCEDVSTHAADLHLEDRVPRRVQPRIQVVIRDAAKESDAASRESVHRREAEQALWDAYNGKRNLVRDATAMPERTEGETRNLHEEIRLALITARAGFQERSARPDGVHCRRDEFTRVINHTLVSVRELSLAEPDSPLKRAGLLPAMRWFVERFEQRTGIHAGLVAPDDPGRLSRTLEMTCFRVVEEAAMNAAKHARASTLTVSIQLSPRSIKLEVSDDGIGFDGKIPKPVPGERTSTGLAGMEERVRYLRGVLRIFSVRGRGSRIVAIMPYSPL
jgi:signal transduction histidine kinase